ncbi:hypothetical protein Cal7507_1336 [Calothrix sp. PCC 7507]|nr:hypothetical protein Cal7507_1336 [Calothrix sp. PCC 7507]
MGRIKSVFGVTQNYLALILEINPVSISKWLDGKARPRLYLHQVEALMEVTKKTLPELREILDPEH